MAILGPQDLRIGGFGCDDLGRFCRELSAFGPIMHVEDGPAVCADVSKSFAGLAFLQTPPTSAGLAQRLLPHYYKSKAAA